MTEKTTCGAKYKKWASNSIRNQRRKQIDMDLKWKQRFHNINCEKRFAKWHERSNTNRRDRQFHEMLWKSSIPKKNVSSLSGQSFMKTSTHVGCAAEKTPEDLPKSQHVLPM